MPITASVPSPEDFEGVKEMLERAVELGRKSYEDPDSLTIGERITNRLLDSLVTAAPPRDREVEAAKARARSDRRFGRAPA